MTSNRGSVLDGRGRIMGEDPRYGRICECGNLKGWQSTRCWSCELERRRSPAFWQRRTCSECGGPKSKEGFRCRRCEDRARIRKPGVGRPQSPDHPWQRRAA